jgi:hypothetical protein
MDHHSDIDKPLALPKTAEWNTIFFRNNKHSVTNYHPDLAGTIEKAANHIHPLW